jgi:hypothetical protein
MTGYVLFPLLFLTKSKIIMQVCIKRSHIIAFLVLLCYIYKIDLFVLVTHTQLLHLYLYCLCHMMLQKGGMCLLCLYNELCSLN